MKWPYMNDPVLLAGAAGLLGALLAGVAEFAMQFNPAGGYEAANYLFFLDISPARLLFGHFLAVLAAPLYVLGYWHVGQAFSRGGSKAAGRFVTLVGGYSFVVANAWIGGRIYLASVVHAAAQTSDPETAAELQRLLTMFRSYNEPLVNVLRAAMLVISIVWVVQVFRRHTVYPRWMTYTNPIVILTVIFALYWAIPPIGVWLLPAAMNVTHIIVFGLSLVAVARAKP